MKKIVVFLMFLIPCILHAQNDPYVVTPEFFSDCHESRISLMDNVNEIIDNNDLFMKIDVTFPLGFSDNYIGPKLDDFGDVNLVPYSGFSLVDTMIMIKSPPLISESFDIGMIISWNGEWLGMGNDRSSKYSSTFVGVFFDIPGKLRIRCGTSIDEEPVTDYDPVSGYRYFSADGDPQIRYFDLGIKVFDVGINSIFDAEAKDLLLLGASYIFHLAGLDISSLLKYFGEQRHVSGIFDIEKRNVKENLNISGSMGLLSDLPIFSFIQADAEFEKLGQMYLKISANYILKKGESENVFGGKVVLGFTPKHLQSDITLNYYYVAISYNDIDFLNSWSVPGDFVISVGSYFSAAGW